MNEINNLSQRKNLFISEFEGLRGLLAAWVVFGHILLICGFSYQDGWFGILFSPVLAVYAFMMLSGFVITAALDTRPTDWISFMVRRFFRLFPIYAICMLLAILLFDLSVAVSQSNTMQTFGPDNLLRLEDAKENFWLYILADATLLQSLLPKFLYPYATETFLVPTWSLSIEWLFYMASPPIVWLITKNKMFALALALLSLITIGIFHNQLSLWNSFFNLNTAFFFLTGILSYLLWKFFPIRQNCLWFKCLFWGGFLLGFSLLNLPYKIWFTTMVLILYPRVHARKWNVLEWGRILLTSDVLQFLGKISYVTYLLHWIVIEVVLYSLSIISPEMNDKYFLTIICVLIVYPVTYIVSFVLHKYIEMPCAQIPKTWSRK